MRDDYIREIIRLLNEVDDESILRKIYTILRVYKRKEQQA